MENEQIIIPPPDVREIIEQTCSAIKTSGKETEVRMLATERANHKYSFLNQNDPYHPYYVRLLNTGSSPRERPVEEEVVRESEALNLDSYYIHSLQTSPIAALDFDLIKLTSIFAAANASAFVSSLVSRELRNPQFDFLKIQHTHNSLYKSLVRSFENVLAADNLWADLKFPDVLQSIRFLSDKMEGYLEPDGGPTRQSDPAEPQYDWSNFVIGDVVDFIETDDFDVPMKKAHIISAPLGSKHVIYDIKDTLSSAAVVADKTDGVYVICPICKGRIIADDFQRHLKIETISKISGSQLNAYHRKFEGVPLETSTETVKRNISSMLGKNKKQRDG